MGAPLEGKVAVITGAGRGIGRACTLLMAQEGCRRVVNDRGVDVDARTPQSEPAEEVVAEIRTITKDGQWSTDELRRLVPVYLTNGIPSPAPPRS